MKLLKIFKRYIKSQLLTLISVVALLIILNYCRSLVPLFISKVFAILQGDDSSTLPTIINSIFIGKEIPLQLMLLAACICCTVLVRDLMNMATDVGISYVSEGIGYNIQTDFYSHVQDLPYSYLNHAQTGDLIQRSISDINRVKRFIGEVLPMCANAFFQIIIYSTQMIRINAQISLILLAPIFCMLIGAIIYFSRNSKIFTDMEEAESKMTAVAQENLTGIRVVKAFANEKYEISKFKQVIDKMMNAWRTIMAKMSTYYGIMDGITYLIMLLSFVLSFYFVRDGKLTFAQATSLFLYVEYVIWPTRTLGRQIGEMNRSDIAGARVMEIIDEQTEYGTQDGTLKPTILGNIEYRDVFFQFKDSNNPTINDINLSIKQGETIALMGKTGCGKSTLVSLLNRMLDCTSGTIYLDGVDIKQINKHYLRKQVGLVLQEPFLFSKTIAENIGISLNSDARTTEAGQNVIKSVARAAAVNNDIEHFELGYNTVVGERGVTLSGGQKQRIAIARMLVDYKPIIIF
ncbi:MAG: ABC transporter ATP-binding protein, partial [Bacilli bacterium]